jgi:hypothetical protein
MRRTAFCSVFCAVATLATFATAPACAGGDEETGMMDPENGPSYFGFVRDKRGLGVPEASVMLKPKDGEAIVVKSNVLGLYRTHLSKEVKPDDVTVSCEKSGYRQVNTARRKSQSADAPSVETSCTLERL